MLLSSTLDSSDSIQKSQPNSLVELIKSDCCAEIAATWLADPILGLILDLKSSCTVKQP